MYRTVAPYALTFATSDTGCSTRAGRRDADAESRRASMVNDFLGPRRCDRMFRGLETSWHCPDTV